MKASELRVGNWYNEFGIPKQVEGKLIVGLIQIEEANKICIDSTPIKLTEDWVLNLGFKEEKPRRGIQKAFRNSTVKIELSNSGNFYFKSRPVPYVHLLQNVYYFNELTGEELTIK